MSGGPALETILRGNFEALARGDLDAIVSTWASDGRYDNPMAGPPAEGAEEVRDRMAALAGSLADSGERLVIDRVTEGPGRAFVEWHIDPGGERRGVHVAELDAAGLITRIDVFARESAEAS